MDLFCWLSADEAVEQPAKIIRLHTDLCVGDYAHQDSASWSDSRWNEEFHKHQVLVMSAQVFVAILRRGWASLSQTNLLVFDECHHAANDPCYDEIMTHYAECSEQPRILGLTTSILNQHEVCPFKLEQTLTTLERVLHSTAETSSDIINVDQYSNKPKEHVIECGPYEDSTGLVEQFGTILEACLEFLDDCQVGFDAEKQKDPRSIPKTVLLECQNVLHSLGPWCASKVIISSILPVSLIT